MAKRANIRVMWHKDVTLKVASGQSARIMGVGYDVPITIGGVTKRFDVLIMNTTSYNVLLGTNALKQFGTIIDFTRDQLYLKSPIGHLPVPMSFLAGEEPVARFATTEVITVPPRSEMFIPVTCSESFSQKGNFTVQTSNRACALHGIMVAQGLFDDRHVPTALLVANVTESDITLSKNMVIAEAKETAIKDSRQIIESEPTTAPIKEVVAIPDFGRLDR